MNIAITGHTKGIGQALYNHFLPFYNVKGFSRTNGFNINNLNIRNDIVKEIKDFDIFINNAYNDFDDSQLLMLKEVFYSWQNQNKLIINISSRFTTADHDYCTTKKKLDKFCHEQQYILPRICNLKPGLTDTSRVKNIQGNKMDVTDIITVIDFCLKNKFIVHEVTFGL
jgi:hypothetical protein